LRRLQALRHNRSRRFGGRRSAHSIAASKAARVGPGSLSRRPTARAIDPEREAGSAQPPCSAT
jgi:hypothetical protein